MQEMKVDDVDKVLDEINDQNDQLQQINTAMQTPIGDAANMDEDELARELEVRLFCVRIPRETKWIPVRTQNFPGKDLADLHSRASALGCSHFSDQGSCHYRAHLHHGMHTCSRSCPSTIRKGSRCIPVRTCSTALDIFLENSRQQQHLVQLLLNWKAPSAWCIVCRTAMLSPPCCARCCAQ